MSLQASNIPHTDLSTEGVKLRELNIHTSDRISFKRCRRVWNWQSPLREFLQKKERRMPLWFGTGWHFVMEDFHGYRQYDSPVDTWRDYVKATHVFYGEEYMPDDWRTAAELGEGMARYYELWLQGRDELKTLWIDGVPQVEVNFKIPLPVSQEILDLHDIDVVYYNGTLDRVIKNDYGMLSIGEYKTAKAIYRAHYLTDPQVTAYSWGAQAIYEQLIEGCYYYQFKKNVPDEPLILRSGQVSTNKQASTTHRFYRDVLIRLYGDVLLAPKANVDHLNYLAGCESSENDGFISRDFLMRNEHSLQVEGLKILMEIEDMLNPNIALYPNPTRECTMFPCDFIEACVNLDDGSDWQGVLELEFEQRSKEKDSWRPLLRKHSPIKEIVLQSPPPLLVEQLRLQQSQQ